MFSKSNGGELRKEVLRTKLTKQRKLINSPIKIRDLVVMPNLRNSSYGESNFTREVPLDYKNLPDYAAKKTITERLAHLQSLDESEKGQDTINRLQKHIKSIAAIANQCHEENYCELKDEEMQLKEEHANTITRISLNEFSLYGKQPLTSDEFAKLVEEIHEMTTGLHDNVHLLLSSFSVIDKQGKLLNITLYVQGGKDAQINSVTKGCESPIDIHYGKNLFSQEDLTQPPTSTSNLNNEFTATSDAHIISSNSVFEVKTKGGAKYIQAVDICGDHFFNHSIRIFDKQLNADHSNFLHFIPAQADHLYTANSEPIHNKAKITEDIVLINPLRDMENQKHYNSVDTNLTLKEETLHKIKKDQSNMNVSQTPGRLDVQAPPFGNDYHVVILNERRLGGYVPKLKTKVDTMNSKIEKNYLDKIELTRHIEPSAAAAQNNDTAGPSL